jgi:hypothetical protein
MQKLILFDKKIDQTKEKICSKHEKIFHECDNTSVKSAHTGGGMATWCASVWRQKSQ